MTSRVRPGIARPQPGKCVRALDEESGPCPTAPQLWTWVCVDVSTLSLSSLFCRVGGEGGWDYMSSRVSSRPDVLGV